ncbi:MAG TPA: AraC family transcriptional regulator [Paenibacillus sp.]|uniref:helix-turn-helix domain-containing protein n=1 Tax=Paenibacillus sp. TaxID=58172 RepID=UPI002BFADE19|nr:AraC family transcriptional regulator [Paenibacillus sp.]HUC94072.1 AraC family transcriptional regulator [Paenibacillus sp.]
MISAAGADPSRGPGMDTRYLERPVAFRHVRLNQVQEHCGRALGGCPVERDFRLVYMLSGNGRLFIQGAELAMPQRHFAWLGPHTEFRLQTAGASSEPVRVMSVHLQQVSAGPALASLFGAGEGGRVLHDSMGIEESILDLKKELQISDSYTLLMLEGVLARLLAQLGRELSLNGAKTADRARAACKQELVEQAIQYVDEHLERITELSSVAAGLGYSHSHLSHAFRERIGISLQTYWANRRMSRAMRLLQAGDRSITQISEELRYQSIHSFSKAFKKVTGITPSDYQSLYGRGWGLE